MKKLILILNLCAVAATAFCADEVDTVAIERDIERALYRKDATLLEPVNVSLAGGLKTEPKTAAFIYLRGFATYAHACSVYGKNDSQALRAALEEADKQLKTVKGEPWESEALALRGLITGQLIDVRGGASAMTLGPKMMQLTSQAFEQLPSSPRVLIYHGVTLLNTPEMFGGDVAEATRLFERAVALFAQFEKTPSAKPGLNWGRAEALKWLSRARMKAGDLAGAKAAAEEALKIEPEYKSVRSHLLPAKKS